MSNMLSTTLPPHLLQEAARLLPTTLTDYIAVAMLGAATVYFASAKQKDPYYHIWFEKPQEKSGHVTSRDVRSATRNIAQYMHDSDKDIVVFWGSQSGTAEMFAHRLARELHGRYGQKVLVADFSDFEPESIVLLPASRLAIFIVATYGEGDPTDNTAEFAKWLNTIDANKPILENLRYGAFGLGNSNYKHYNRMVDLVSEGLSRLGAQSLTSVGKANDANGMTEEDYITWKDGALETIARKLSFSECEAVYRPVVSIDEGDLPAETSVQSGEPGILAGSAVPRASRISQARQLFNSPNRYCLHIEFDLTDQPEMIYKTGDHLAVWPSNPDSEVERLLRVLGLTKKKDKIINIKAIDMAAEVMIPNPTTIEALFRYYLEICGPVSRDVVSGLAQFAPTPQAKQEVQNLGRNKDAYNKLLAQRQINLGLLLELLSSFASWTELPLSYLLETLRHMKPRYYSISSSSSVSPRTLSITAIVANSTPTDAQPGETIHGVTTNYLHALSNNLQSQPHPGGLTYQLGGPCDVLKGGRVFTHIRQSKFKLPTLGSSPIIMVAAGTGLAPFRAFLSERCKLKSVGKPVGQMILYFGCRNPEEDYIYEDEIQELQQALGRLLQVFTAFSRVSPQERKYVQDRVSEHGEDILRLMDNGAYFYICGRAAMARKVQGAVAGSLKKIKNWGDLEIEEWQREVKRRNRWQEDVWG